jgi:hypothetical protein
LRPDDHCNVIDCRQPLVQYVHLKYPATDCSTPPRLRVDLARLDRSLQVTTIGMTNGKPKILYLNI